MEYEKMTIAEIVEEYIREWGKPIDENVVMQLAELLKVVAEDAYMRGLCKR